MELEKWKRNQVFKAIQAAGLAPEGFGWDGGADESCIRYQSSETYFVFGGVPGRYVARYVAGDAPVEEREALSWEAQMRHVERWLDAIKRDVEMPDLWAELRRETELLGAAADEAIENTPFTPDEREEIAERLQERRDYARRTYSLSEEQMRVLDAKLDHLVDATGRLGRTDWRGLFFGTMFAFVLTAALPPESARHILLTFLTAGCAKVEPHGDLLV
jgi:AcrR family transcriptional regulator